jgi:hypothetical protein
MKVFLNKNKLNLAVVEYDLENACIKPDSDISVVCINHGMGKSELITQLRNVANYLETQPSDVIILQ